jgi:hypothetical protein
VADKPSEHAGSTYGEQPTAWSGMVAGCSLWRLRGRSA